MDGTAEGFILLRSVCKRYRLTEGIPCVVAVALQVVAIIGYVILIAYKLNGQKSRRLVLQR